MTYSHSVTSVTGICCKSEHVSDDPSSADRISRNDSKEMTLSLPQKKLQSIKQISQDLYYNPQTAVLKLTKVLSHLKLKSFLILPAKLHCRLFQ